jgi:hypothetical protein
MQDFLPLALHVGDVLEFAASGPRKVASFDFAIRPYVRVEVEGAPLTAEDTKAPVKIVRQP